MLTLIAAVGQDGAIGAKNAIPWHSPADLRRFRQLTMGRPILMGRRTHESIGKPLPGRRNIVISRDPSYASPGCEIANSLQCAIAAAESESPGDIFIIGGAQIYRQALPLADCLRITEVAQKTPSGDAFFPLIDKATWEETAREELPAEDPPLLFVDYRRRAARKPGAPAA